MRLCNQKSDRFIIGLQELSDLSPLQMVILKERYIKLLKSYEARCIRLAFLFYIARVIVTIGSLIVPALLSIQYTGSSADPTNPESTSYRIYWTTWTLSLLVTTSNGLVSIFKLDKRYYFVHTTYEQLRSEGWQFLELSGRYSGLINPGQTPTHQNQFVYFCSIVEKIKMKQVEEEYYKVNENQSQTSHAKITTKQDDSTTEVKEETQTSSSGLDNLIPPTPLKPILDQAQNLPPDLLKQIVAMMNQNSPRIDGTQVSVSVDLSGNSPA